MSKKSTIPSYIANFKTLINLGNYNGQQIGYYNPNSSSVTLTRGFNSSINVSIHSQTALRGLKALCYFPPEKSKSIAIPSIPGLINCNVNVGCYAYGASYGFILKTLLSQVQNMNPNYQITKIVSLL